MNKKIFFIVFSFFLATKCWAQTIDFFGFGQVKYESQFTVPKNRIGVFFVQNKTKSTLYVDFDENGQPNLGFVSMECYFNVKFPRLIIGRTLDPVTYQFPGPHQIPTINFPSSLFNKPYGVGIFFQETHKPFWLMIGLTNGNGKFQDDNQSLDFTSRIAYDLPLGFKIGGVYRQGNQPFGNRKIFGGDLTFQKSIFWLNSGYNVYQYNIKKTGSWLWGTVDLTKHIQLVGLCESITISSQAQNTWTAGINILPDENLIIKFNILKNIDGKFDRAILFQQKYNL